VYNETAAVIGLMVSTWQIHRDLKQYDLGGNNSFGVSGLLAFLSALCGESFAFLSDIQAKQVRITSADFVGLSLRVKVRAPHT
jgi:hypothetical protein